jgi:pyruvate formate lyase activating enzyme
VDVLPFHQLGQFKWKKLGIPYQLETTEPPTEEAVEAAVRLFRAEGLTAF